MKKKFYEVWLSVPNIETAWVYRSYLTLREAKRIQDESHAHDFVIVEITQRTLLRRAKK